MSNNSPILSCSKVITTHTFQSKQPTSVYSPHRGLINCATFNHTNKVIASCGQDGKIILVSAQQKQKILAQLNFDGRKQTFGPYGSTYSQNQNHTNPTSVNTCLFSPHSKYIAAGSADNYVKIWQMKNHKDIFLTLKCHNDSITSLAWNKSQDILASSSLAGTITMHSMKTKSLLQQISLKNQDSINAIRFSQGVDFHKLAACTQSGTIKVWDLQTNRPAKLLASFQNINKTSVTSLSFSTFNPVLLVTSSIDQNLTFYDISQKKAVKTIATQQPLTAVNFYSDGHTLLAGGIYGGLFIYDLRKPGKPKQKLSGHDTAIKYIDFHKQKQSQFNQSRQSTKLQQNTNSKMSRTSGTSSVTRLGSKQLQKKQTEKVGNSNQQNNLQFKRQSTSSRTQNTPQLNKQKQVSTANNIQNQNTVSNNPVSQPSIYSNSYNRRTELSNMPPVANTYLIPSNTLQNNYVGVQKIKPHLASSQKMVSSNNQGSSNMQQQFDKLRMKLQDSMSEKMEQFQIQQQQLKIIIQKTFQQSRQKDKKIKQLEDQIHNMKKNRY